MARGRGGRERERHIGSPSLVTGSARAKQKHVLRRGGEGKGKGREARQASKQQGGRRPPLHATHPSHGPPATHNLYLHEIARSCISHTHKIKTGRAALRARHLSMCFSLGVQVVVSSFRVMMIGDYYFFSFNYSPLSVPLVRY